MTSTKLSLAMIVISSMAIVVTSCSRSPYEGAGNASCDSGDRVIVNERLFCVFEGSRLTRPAEPSPEETLAGEEAGTQVEPEMETSAGDTAPDETMNYCPMTAPVAHRYETLTICGEEEVSAQIVEAVVAQWSADYSEESETTGGHSEAIAGEDLMEDPAEIGVIFDSGLPNDE